MKRVWPVIAFTAVLMACGIEPKPAPAGSCGPATCPAGCCLNGSCRSGVDDLACGKGGAACQDCYAAFQLCLSDRTCGTGTPPPPPPVKWTMTVVDGNVNALNGTMQWDPDGTPPDTFLVVNNQRTPTVPNSTAPKWNYSAEFTEEQLTVSGVGMQVFDDDGVTNDRMTQPRTFVFTSVNLGQGMASVQSWDAVVRINFSFARK